MSDLIIDRIDEPEVKASLCRRLLHELPDWFGRPESNAYYVDRITTKRVFSASLQNNPIGIVACEVQFTHTCHVWLLAVSPSHHRAGVGTALMRHVLIDAQASGCQVAVVATVGPSARSTEYDSTRAFYEKVGFAPLVEFEPEPDDYLLWMVRPIGNTR